MKPSIKYIGKQITIKSIKDFILDSGLIEEKIILLNSKNFDDIVLEYLDFYKESIEIPYYLLGILIAEDESKNVPLDRIGLINDNEYENQNLQYEETFDLYDGEKAFRCGFCGNIVDNNGNELHGDERNRIIRYIENFNNAIVNKAYGMCCKEEWQG